MEYMDRIHTRILIISDTHSALPDSGKHPEYPISRPFPKIDVAIHCGDLTSNGMLDQHERALKLLEVLPAPLKIVIPGNHDLTLDEEYCEFHGDEEFRGTLECRDHIGRAYGLYNDESAREAGIVYLTEGIRTFKLDNGANLTVYASAYTPEFCDWAFPYPRDVDRYNKTNCNSPDNPVPDFDRGAPQVSIMITHGPPKDILDRTSRGVCVGCEHLRKAVERCRPLLHCFGHIHEAWGSHVQEWGWSTPADCWSSNPTQPQAISKSIGPLKIEGMNHIAYADGTSLVRGQETLFVNASIMSVTYKPVQKPWIVDLMLPRHVDSAQTHT